MDFALVNMNVKYTFKIYGEMYFINFYYIPDKSNYLNFGKE